MRPRTAGKILGMFFSQTGCFRSKLSTAPSINLKNERKIQSHNNRAAESFY